MPLTIRSKRFSEAGSLIWSRRIFEERKEDPEEIIPPVPRRLFRLVNLSIPAISSFALMLLQDQINIWFIGQQNDTT